MKIAILGRTKMLYDSIEYLKKEGHEIVLIGTCKAAPEYDVKEIDFANKANELGVPFFCDTQINSSEINKILRKAKADIAISVNWLTIIKEETISIFPHGILNAHCGDLPRYKGNACPNWAILKDEKEFAVSVHFMEEELDSGDIVVKEYYPITEETTITDIYNIVEKEVPLLFSKALDKIVNGDRGIVQSREASDILRCYPRIPTDSFIDWNMSCDEILRIVRASLDPFEGAYTFWGNMKIYIMNATKKEYEYLCYVYPGQIISIGKENGSIEVAAGDGIIGISKIKVDGEVVDASVVLKSTRIRLNYCLQEEIYRLHNKVIELEKEISLLKGNKDNV